jgi:hypothetical protein
MTTNKFMTQQDLYSCLIFKKLVIVPCMILHKFLRLVKSQTLRLTIIPTIMNSQRYILKLKIIVFFIEKHPYVLTNHCMQILCVQQCTLWF